MKKKNRINMWYFQACMSSIISFFHVVDITYDLLKKVFSLTIACLIIIIINLQIQPVMLLKYYQMWRYIQQIIIGLCCWCAEHTLNFSVGYLVSTGATGGAGLLNLMEHLNSLQISNGVLIISIPLRLSLFNILYIHVKSKFLFLMFKTNLYCKCNTDL